MSNLNGITPSTIGISYSGENITLDSISELAHEFNFTVHNVLNPISTSIPINIQFSAENSLGYVGEYGSGIPTYATCDYPCKTCENILVAQCLTCFPENHVVFGSLVNQPYLYVPPPFKQCVHICPSHYKNSPDSCGICDPNCLECNITATTCTACYANSFLFESYCREPPCPPKYFQNDINWRCDRNIYIYIYSFYIECDSRCEDCNGPSNMHCLTCSPTQTVVLNPLTRHCECLIGYYAKPNSGDCQGILELIYIACHSSCGSCKGLTEYDCLDCKRAIMRYDPITSSCNCPPKHYKTLDGNCLRKYNIYIYI